MRFAEPEAGIHKAAVIGKRRKPLTAELIGIKPERLHRFIIERLNLSAVKLNKNFSIGIKRHCNGKANRIRKACAFNFPAGLRVKLEKLFSGGNNQGVPDNDRGCRCVHEALAELF